MKRVSAFVLGIAAGLIILIVIAPVVWLRWLVSGE